MIFHADFDIEFNTQLIIGQYLHRKYEDFGHSYDDRLAQAFPAKTIEAIRKATTEEDLKTVYQDFLVKNRITVLGPVIALGVEKILNDHQDEIVGVLENVYGKSVPFESIKVRVVHALGYPFGFKPEV